MTNPAAYGTVGDRIREIRLLRGLSQRQLASPDLSDSYISLIESGRRTPTTDTITTLAERLDCSVSYLRFGVDDTTITGWQSELHAAERDLSTGHADDTLHRLTNVASHPHLHRFGDLHTQVHTRIVAALERLGRYDEALTLLHDLLTPTGPTRTPPMSWIPWADLVLAQARCQHRTGQHPAAIRTLEHAFTTASTHIRSEPADAAHAAEAAVRVATALTDSYLNHAELLLARQLVAHLTTLADTCAHPRTQAAAYHQAAVTAHASGDADHAADLATRAFHLLHTDPELATLDDLRAHCATLLLLHTHPTQPHSAASTGGDADGDTTVTLDGVRDLLLQRLGHLLHTVTATSVTPDPALPKTLIDLAETELLLGHHQDAAAHAHQALGHTDKPGPDTPVPLAIRALNVLGQAHTHLGNLEQAINALTRRAELLQTHAPSRHAAQAWLDIAHAIARKSTPTTNPPGPEAPPETPQEHIYRRALQTLALLPPTQGVRRPEDSGQ